MLSPSRAGLALTLLLVACGGDPAAPADGGGAGPDATAGTAPIPPAEPEPPLPAAAVTPVSLLPCPGGWTEVAPVRIAGATLCSPGAAPWAACSLGSARFPGEERCATLTACAAVDGFPADAPASGDVRYVRPSAVAGDGSRAAPFRTLAEALAGATADTTLALSEGSHEGGVTVPDGVRLMGVCPADTIIAGAASGEALVVGGTGVRAEGLSLRGADAALSAPAGATATLRAVEVVGGVTIDGELIVDSVALRDGAVAIGAAGSLVGARVHGADAEVTVTGGVLDLTDAALSGGATAVTAEGGATVALGASLLSGQRERGVRLRGADTEATLTDLVAQDQGEGTGTGAGVEALAGTTLRAERVAVLGPSGNGLIAMGAEVDLRDVAVRDAGLTERALAGAAFMVGDDAEVSAAGLSVEASGGIAVSIFRGTAHLEDLTILETSADDGAAEGVGLAVGSARVTVRRGYIGRTRLVGALVSDPGGQLRLEDVRVVDTLPAGARLGRGLTAQAGAKLVLSRVSIEGSHEDGVFVVGVGASVSGSDVTITGTRPATTGLLVGLGVGLHAQEEGRFDLTRVEVSDSIGLGVVLFGDGTEARLRDLVVRDTTSWQRAPLDGSHFGRGIDVQQGSRLVVERATIERNRDLGIGVSPGCDVTLRDVAVRDTSDELAAGIGRGLAIYGAAAVRGERVVFEGNRQGGAFAFGEGATLDLLDLFIRRTDLSTCIADGCEGGGIGLGAYEGAAVSARRFIIDDNALAGVQVADRGGLDLTDGVISGSPIGASVVTEGYDISRLSDEVRYRDNGTNLDSAALPLPAPGPVFMAMGEM